MKTNLLRRRQFLQTAGGTIGAASLVQTLNLWSAPAETTTDVNAAKVKAQLEKIFAEFKDQGKAYLCTPYKEGQMMNLLAKAVRARNVLEVGTSVGTLTMWLGLAMEETGGKVTTIEILADRVKVAKENTAQAGLSRRVNFKEADAHEIIPTLKDTFDMVFLNADKDGQPDYFKKIYPNKLAPGGLLLTHNAIKQRDKLEAYLKLVTEHADFDTTIVSATMDDGYAISYRQRHSL